MGSPASPKQPSEWARRLPVAFRETSLVGFGGPGRHVARGQLPARRPRPSSRPGLGSGHATSAICPVLGSGTCYHARPEKGHVWGVQPPQSSLPSGREDCRLHSGRQAWSGLGALAAMWPGVSSPRAGPAPPPGPGLGLATPLAPPARGWGVVPVTTLGPKRATRGASSLPKAAFRVGAKTAGCIPGYKLGRVWGPWPPCGQGSAPHAPAPPLLPARAWV